MIDQLQDQGEFRWQMEGDRVCILSADGSKIGFISDGHSRSVNIACWLSIWPIDSLSSLCGKGVSPQKPITGFEMKAHQGQV